MTVRDKGGAEPPVGEDLAGGGAVLDWALPVFLTSGHVLEDILHGLAVGEVALLLTSGAHAGVEEHHQLILDQHNPIILCPGPEDNWGSEGSGGA